MYLVVSPVFKKHFKTKPKLNSGVFIKRKHFMYLVVNFNLSFKKEKIDQELLIF